MFVLTLIKLTKKGGQNRGQISSNKMLKLIHPYSSQPLYSIRYGMLGDYKTA